MLVTNFCNDCVTWFYFYLSQFSYKCSQKNNEVRFVSCLYFKTCTLHLAVKLLEKRTHTQALREGLTFPKCHKVNVGTHASNIFHCRLHDYKCQVYIYIAKTGCMAHKTRYLVELCWHRPGVVFQAKILSEFTGTPMLKAHEILKSLKNSQC